MNKYSAPLAIKLITFFYYLLALTITGLFIYTYITVPMALGSRIVGIFLGVFLGSSIFFLGLSFWRGIFWARMVIILVSGFIVIVCLVALIFGKSKSLAPILYIIITLVLNGLFLKLLFMKNVRLHFRPRFDIISAVSNEIKKVYEKNLTKHSSTHKK